LLGKDFKNSYCDNLWLEQWVADKMPLKARVISDWSYLGRAAGGESIEVFLGERFIKL
jgi:hypothetical protein